MDPITLILISMAVGGLLGGGTAAAKGGDTKAIAKGAGLGAVGGGLGGAAGAGIGGLFGSAAGEVGAEAGATAGAEAGSAAGSEAGALVGPLTAEGAVGAVQGPALAPGAFGSGGLSVGAPISTAPTAAPAGEASTVSQALAAQYADNPLLQGPIISTGKSTVGKMGGLAAALLASSKMNKKEEPGDTVKVGGGGTGGGRGPGTLQVIPQIPMAQAQPMSLEQRLLQRELLRLGGYA